MLRHFVEFSLQSQSCRSTCIILMILLMKCKCIQTSGLLLNNFTRPDPLGIEKYSVKISNMASNCATTSLLQYHQNGTSNEARGKKSTYFPNGKEGICAGSRSGSQFARVCAIVLIVSSTVCSLAQHCSTICTNLRGPNLAFVLASGDAPLVHKHGIAVFQGGHRVKENRTELRSEFTV